MKKVTISTKVSPDTVKALTDAGFGISDSLQVGLRLFLEIPEEERWSLILQQRYIKKARRASAIRHGTTGFFLEDKKNNFNN